MDERLEHSTPKTAIHDTATVSRGIDASNGAVALHTPDPAKVSAGLAGSYQPQIEPSTKSHKLTDPAFNLGSFLTYYPMLRFAGYTAEVLYSQTLKGVKENKFDTLTGNKAFTEPLPKSFTGKIKYTYDNTKEWMHNKHHKEKKLAGYLAFAEAAAFTSMAGIYWAKEHKHFLHETDLAVAAERGFDEKEINYGHLKASKNPLIQSAYDRQYLQHRMRVAAGATFAGGIPLGIVANGLLITAERTIFYRPLGFDILKKAVVDVQSNNLGESSKDELIDNLIRVMQQTRRDHDRDTISREQIDGLRPVLDKVADDIIDGRFGFEGALYIMGGGVIIPENPEQSMKNFQHVHNVGVSGIAHEAKWIREKSGARPNQLWEEQMRATRSDGYVAESAQSDSLKKFQNQLSARGPAAAGSRDGSRRGGSDSRGGTGLVM